MEMDVLSFLVVQEVTSLGKWFAIKTTNGKDMPENALKVILKKFLNSKFEKKSALHNFF